MSWNNKKAFGKYFYNWKAKNGKGNVSKRRQPDQRADNSTRPPMGQQHRENPVHGGPDVHAHCHT